MACRAEVRGQGDMGTCHEDQEMEEIIPTETVSETAQSRPRSFSPRLETSGGGQTPGTGQLLTTSGERNMRDKYLHSRHPDTEGCVSLHPRHPCVSRPCNLIWRPRPGIYLGSFSYKKYPESIIHHHILAAIITTQGGVYREEKKFNWFEENSVLKLSK